MNLKYPEVLLLPLLMFADYFLAVLGVNARQKRSAGHLAASQYEVNPYLQKTISQKKFFNLQYAVWVIGWTAILTWLVEYGDLPDAFKQLLLGTFLVIFGILVATHLSNLFVFWYLANRPSPIFGNATMPRQLLLSIAMYQTVIVMVPTLVLAISTRSNFARGAVLGTALLLCNHLNWMRQLKRAETYTQPRVP